MTPVTVFTDGACLGNPGPGGYAAILVCGERRHEVRGGYRRTTNNRMELMAAIAALQTLKRPCQVTLHSDSRYLVDGLTKGWAIRWRARGWRKADGAPALNVDLWQRLLDLCCIHQVRCVWVQGHAGHTENEMCDRMSVAMARGTDLAEDDGFGAGP